MIGQSHPTIRSLAKSLPLILTVLTTALPRLHADDAASTTDKPVKVYILSGQSNMVGIGQAHAIGMSRFDTYTSSEAMTKENQGCVVSLYSGAYDPKVDYDKKKPAETHTVRVGYWPHKVLPTLDGEHTQIARGYIRIEKPGRYRFTGSGGSITEIDGKVVHSSMPGYEAETKTVRYEAGVYPVKITNNGKGGTYLGYKFLDTPGTLHTVVKEQGKYPHLLDAEGEWASRDDVWYKGVITAAANKWLSVGCGAGQDKIGPELGFGWLMGDYHEEPVLILKASQGNRSLAWDFLPPGSKRFEVEEKDRDGKVKTMVYAGYKDPSSRWPKGEMPEKGGWYAGKQYDDCFNAAKEVLAQFDENFPMWAGRGYEIAGFVWWQGHKDSGSTVHQSKYEENLVRLIHALRKEFDAPKAPFVVGTVGFGGREGMSPQFKPIVEAQLAVGDPARHPEFKGKVKSVDTRDFWKPAEASPRNQDFHYNQNGEVYYLVGEALGKAMLELLQGK